MTRDDIMRWAIQARLPSDYATGEPMWPERIERFAALVAAAEREACAELVWPTQQVKVWSDEELTAMTGAFNRSQEKHGWYETIMAVGAAALKGRASAIRARGKA